MQFINAHKSFIRESKVYSIVAIDGSRIMRDGEIRMQPKVTLSSSDER